MKLMGNAFIFLTGEGKIEEILRLSTFDAYSYLKKQIFEEAGSIPTTALSYPFNI